jgi:hypothetical protein
MSGCNSHLGYYRFSEALSGGRLGSGKMAANLVNDEEIYDGYWL